MKINNKSINNTLNFNASIKDAVKLLEECKIKVIVVLADDNKVLGTITDGDIRRGLLKSISLSSD